MSYTIKPLNWGELRTSNGMGAVATTGIFWIQVKPMNQAELYKWEIQRGTTSIMSGVSQTLEQGKIDCEKAWQEFLADNLLKEEILDYNLEQLGLK